MAMRANWKGFLKVGDLVCSVGLYGATTTSDRVAFHMLNRSTGNRLKREFIDSEAGETVDRQSQVKGFQIENDRFVTLSAEEMAAVLPDNDKTFDIAAFIPCTQIDDLYLGRPYYLVPADRHADKAFEVLRSGMKAKGVAAIAEALLFRRVRSLLIPPRELACPQRYCTMITRFARRKRFPPSRKRRSRKKCLNLPNTSSPRRAASLILRHLTISMRRPLPRS